MSQVNVIIPRLFDLVFYPFTVGTFFLYVPAVLLIICFLFRLVRRLMGGRF